MLSQIFSSQSEYVIMINNCCQLLTLILRKGVSSITQLPALLLLLYILLSFHDHGFEHSLLINVDLLHGPAFELPSLDLPLKILIPHLPHFNFTSNFDKLLIHLLQFVLNLDLVHGCQGLHKLLKMRLTFPSLLELRL